MADLIMQVFWWIGLFSIAALVGFVLGTGLAVIAAAVRFAVLRLVALLTR